MFRISIQSISTKVKLLRICVFFRVRKFEIGGKYKMHGLWILLYTITGPTDQSPLPTWEFQDFFYWNWPWINLVPMPSHKSYQIPYRCRRSMESYLWILLERGWWFAKCKSEKELATDWINDVFNQRGSLWAFFYDVETNFPRNISQ